MSFLQALIFRSMPSSSVISSAASRRRVLPGDVARPDRGDQGARLGSGQELLRAAGQQLQQQPVDPVDGLGPCPAELVTPVGEQAQHHQVRADLDGDQVTGP